MEEAIGLSSGQTTSSGNNENGSPTKSNGTSLLPYEVPEEASSETIKKDGEETRERREGDDEAPSGSQSPGRLWEGMNRDELTLLLLQTLESMGFNEAKTALETESGLTVEPPEATHLRISVFEGEWTKALELLELLNISEEGRRCCRFQILEQKFCECLFGGKMNEALTTLREEFSATPFDEDTQLRFFHCCSFLMLWENESKSSHLWREEGSRMELWRRIHSRLPPSLAVPQRRLVVLLNQARQLQELYCQYHNSIVPSPFSLLQDHHCHKTALPSHVFACLDSHQDEVWHVNMSHNGKYIVSAGKDQEIHVFSSQPPNFSCVKTFSGHSQGVGYIAFSPTDLYLATSSLDHTIRIWSLDFDEALCVIRMQSAMDGDDFMGVKLDTISGIVWLPKAKHRLAVAYERQILIFDIQSSSALSSVVTYKESFVWLVPSRLRDLAVSADGGTLMVLGVDNVLRGVDEVERRCTFTLEEAEAVSCIAASKLNSYCLFSIGGCKPVLKLWDFVERRVVQQYRGHQQCRFVVRPALAGPSESFVVSGSEDCLIYIWHRHFGSLVKILSGHAGTVNAVVWPAISADCPWLVSVSDDHTVLVWHTRRREQERLEGASEVQ